MSADPFLALGGFAVGIPPELVIDENGNVVNNVNAPNSNVSANRVFANGYFYANGDPLSIGASGSNTQVQYNNNGLLGASPNFVFNSATNLLTVSKVQINNTANLGNVANVKILGGTNGYFLQTDGAGNLTWAPASGGNGGNGNPGGANTQVQFNNAGTFGGDAGFTYDQVANVMTVGNITTANIAADYIVLNWDVTANVVQANYLYGDGSNITNVHAIVSDVANSVAGANVTGQVNFAAVANSVAGANVTGQVAFANVANNVAGANVAGQVANALVAGTVYTSSQPNITSVGNLTSLTVVGNTTLGNQVVSNYFIGNLFGTANLARNVTYSAQPNITSVGTLTSLTVSGATILGNTATANYFIGRFYGIANSATVANTANVATIANVANYALTANIANYTDYTNVANFANVAYSVSGSNVVGPVANANVAKTVSDAAQPNITSVGTLTSVAVTGNVTAGNVYANTGTIKAANLYGLIQTPTQPGIVTVGTLTGLNVAGNINSYNIDAGNLLTANYISGTLTTNSQANINYLGNIGWLNVDSNVPNSNGNITFNGSMTGIGEASNIWITGNLNAANYVEANYLIGTIITNDQPNITSLGTLTSLNVEGPVNLGNVGNITILGGNANYVLSTDGAGNLNWVPQTGGGGNGNTNPGGLNTQIQFNDNGAFGGSSGLTWNKSTNYLYVGGNANINGVLRSQTYVSNVATGSPPLEVISTTPVANLAVETAATVRNNAQPNITSVGTLVNLAVAGNISAANLSLTNTFSAPNITVSGTIGTSNLIVSGSGTFQSNTVVSASGTLTVNGKINTASASNVNLGSISNIHIAGGINGYVLTTDGSGQLSWTAGGGGGNGSPGGSNTQIQYNNGGLFAGSPNFTFDAANSNVQIAGNLQANTFTMGSGAYEFCRSNVYFATTVTPSEQILLSTDAQDLAAIDYVIISTDGIIRNFVRISAVLVGNSLNYVEYSTLPVNGYVGDFNVTLNPGNIIVPASVELRFTPQSANTMTHKMMITRYNE